MMCRFAMNTNMCTCHLVHSNTFLFITLSSLEGETTRYIFYSFKSVTPFVKQVPIILTSHLIPNIHQFSSPQALRITSSHTYSPTFIDSRPSRPYSSSLIMLLYRPSVTLSLTVILKNPTHAEIYPNQLAAHRASGPLPCIFSYPLIFGVRHVAVSKILLLILALLSYLCKKIFSTIP